MWRRSKLAEALSHPIIRKHTSRLHSADCWLAPRSSLKPAIGRGKGRDSFFGPYGITDDFVQLPAFEFFRDAESYYATALHELTPYGPEIRSACSSAGLLTQSSGLAIMG